MSRFTIESICRRILAESRLIDNTPIEEISNKEVIAFFFLYMPELVNQELTDEALEQIRNAVIHYRDKYPRLIIDAKYDALTSAFNGLFSEFDAAFTDGIDVNKTIYFNHHLPRKIFNASAGIVNNLNSMFKAIGAGTSPKNFTYREYFNMLPKVELPSDCDNTTETEAMSVMLNLKQAIATCVANLPNEDAIDFLAQVIVKLSDTEHILDRSDIVVVGADAYKFSTIQKYMDNLT